MFGGGGASLNRDGQGPAGRPGSAVPGDCAFVLAMNRVEPEGPVPPPYVESWSLFLGGSPNVTAFAPMSKEQSRGTQL